MHKTAMTFLVLDISLSLVPAPQPNERAAMSFKSPVLVLLVGMLIVGCSNSTQPDQPQSINFVISTTNILQADGPQASVDITVCADRLPDSMPTIVFCGKVPDALGPSPFSWGFTGIPADSLIPWSIAVGTDTARGLVRIPPAVDSVWCNGVYVSPKTIRNATLSAVNINLDSIFRFTWKSTEVASGFLFSYAIGAYNSNYQLNSWQSGSNLYVKSDSLALKDANAILSYNPVYLEFSVANAAPAALQANAKPAVSAGAISAYYDVRGPEYQCFLSVARTGFRKTAQSSSR
jgi:hypothetical protein